MPRCGSAPMACRVNWHFKPEEINYVLKDSGTSRADRACRHAASAARARFRSGVTVLSVPTPPEILANYKIDPDHLGAPDFAIDFEILAAASSRATTAQLVPQPQSMIYTSGTTGHPKGVRRFAPTPEQTANAEAHARDDLWPQAGRPRACCPGRSIIPRRTRSACAAGRLGGALVLDAALRRRRILAPDRDARRIDTIFMVPTMFIRLMKLPEEVRGKYDVSSLRHIIHAAAPCPADVKRAMIEWWGPVIYEFYGSTEIRRGHLCHFRGRAEEARHRRQDSRRARNCASSAMMEESCRRARSAKSIRASPAIRFHLSQQAGEARRDRPRRLHHLRRRRLYRRRRLRLHLRPQARHGDFGRRQHLPGRDRGGAACRARRA